MHLDLSRTAGIVIQILLSQMTKKYLLKLTPLKLFRCPAVILLSVDEPLFTNLLESNWIHFDKMFWKLDEEQFFCEIGAGNQVPVLLPLYTLKIRKEEKMTTSAVKTEKIITNVIRNQKRYLVCR